MNFQGMTADRLLEQIKEFGEGRKWEFKRADILLSDTRAKLARQVSAFANTGGGFIAIGIAETVKGQEYKLEPCTQLRGREPMKDYLSKMVSICVERPLSEFWIHSLPLDEGSSDCLFVIEIEDSQTAPHQTNDDQRAYYWRNGIATEPAPHFHLELLRNRTTKAVLRIEGVSFQPEIFLGRKKDGVQPAFELTLTVKVKNCSWQSASHMGVHLETPKNNYRWQLRVGDCPCLDDGACAHGARSALLPDETVKLNIPLTLQFTPLADLSPHNVQEFLTDVWCSTNIELRPVSQDHIGTPVRFPDLNGPDGNARMMSFNDWMRISSRER